jgi:hypothetical protein
MTGSVSERTVECVRMAGEATELGACLPSTVEGAATATAAKSEKRAIVNFMLLLLKERLESTGDREVVMMMKCDRRSLTRKKMAVLGRSGVAAVAPAIQRGPLCICMLPGVESCHAAAVRQHLSKQGIIHSQGPDTLDLETSNMRGSIRSTWEHAVYWR